METDLDPNEFDQRIDADERSYVLDVRTRQETQEGTLPDANNIDFFSSSFKDEVLKLEKDKHYYVYCRSGQRSGQAVKFMTENGYTAFNLKGGVMAWAKR